MTCGCLYRVIELCRYCVLFTLSLLTVRRMDGDSGLSHGWRFPRSGVATVEEAEQISAQAGRWFQRLRHIHHRAPQFDSQACVQALRWVSRHGDTVDRDYLSVCMCVMQMKKNIHSVRSRTKVLLMVNKWGTNVRRSESSSVCSVIEHYILYFKACWWVERCKANSYFWWLAN